MLSPQKIMALQAVRKEFQDISANPILNIGAQVGLINKNNVMEWRCTMLGPKDTPFADDFFF